METHFDREVSLLKEELLQICAKAEQSVVQACSAFQTKDVDLCRKVIQSDEEIDRDEVRLEESCLKILALHQPVAKDLRMVVATLKINSDLERIADLAVNFAARSKFILKRSEFTDHQDFSKMAEKSRAMLRNSIDSLVELDLAKAKQVWHEDEIVDEIHKNNYAWVYNKIASQPEDAEFYINQLSLSRYLERIADFATNIAEDVIYLISGEIVRHNVDKFLGDVPE